LCGAITAGGAIFHDVVVVESGVAGIEVVVSLCASHAFYTFASLYTKQLDVQIS